MEDERSAAAPGVEADLHAPGRRLDHAFAALAALPAGTYAHALHRMAAVEVASPTVRARLPQLRFLAPDGHPLSLFDPSCHLALHQAWLQAGLEPERVARVRVQTVIAPDLADASGTMPVGWYDATIVDLVSVEGVDAVIVGLTPSDQGTLEASLAMPTSTASASAWFQGTRGFRLRIDTEGIILGATMNAAEVFEQPLATVYGSPLSSVIHTDDHGLLELDGDQGSDAEDAPAVRVRVLRQSSGERWFDAALWWIQDGDRPTWGIVDFRDAQSQVESEQAHQSLEREFHAHDRLVQMLGQVDDIVLLGSDRHGIVYANDAASALFARDEAGVRPFDLARPLILAEIDPERDAIERDGRQWVGDIVLPGPVGPVTYLTTISPVVDDDTNETFYGIVMRDVSSERAHEAELSQQARRDHLTGLPNRLALMDHLEASRRPMADDSVVTLCFIDVDNLKIVNDGLGHDAGDQLLVAVAHALDALPDADLVARFGGDEFVVVFEDLAEHEAQIHAQAILDVIGQVSVPGIASSMSASVGVATSTRARFDADHLIRNADAAMYAAKRSGRARVAHFDDRVRDQVTRRFVVEAALRRFLEQGGPELALQPVVEVASGRVEGFEALSRWGGILPTEFIPVAEDSGLIVALGQSMLEQALAALVRLRAIHQESTALRVGVNVSARQLLDPRYAATVLDTIAASGIEPSGVILELTESVLIDPSDEVDVALRKVREGGVQLSLDDFGSGYSSLAYLRRYPIDSLKLDTSYIQMLGDHETRVITEAVVTMATRLGLRVVAEGVETPEQLQLVRDIGIGLAQGFLLGPPATVEELLAQGLGPRLGGLSPRG